MTLIDIMSKLGIEPDPIKQLGGKAAELISRVKLGGGHRESGRLLALKTLSLGIEGKACLWSSPERGWGAATAPWTVSTSAPCGAGLRASVKASRSSDSPRRRRFSGVHAPVPS